MLLSANCCEFLQVIPGSAADQGSGLQPGDLIIAVNGVHISDWDENKLLEAFRGDDIIGSKCRLTIERPEAKHLGPVDVEVLRTNASFAKEVELLFLLGQEHAALLQSQASHDALNASLQAMMHQAVALERHRILNEQVLAARLRSLQGRVLESITDAERRITVSANDVDNQRLKDLEGTHEHMSELLMLLRGPPTVPPAKLASAVRGANMGAHDLLLILEAIAQERLSTNEAVGRIHASPQDDDLLAKLKASEARCAAQDREITNLKDKIEAGCQACKEKDEDIAKLTRNPAQAQRASPKITRAAVPPPAAPQPPPLIVPPGGKFDKIVSAVIKSDIPGAIVYCTTDGSAPTQSNCAQSGPSPLLMQVEKSSRIRAVCSANGRTTLEAEAEFVLEAPAALAGKAIGISFCLFVVAL